MIVGFTGTQRGMTGAQKFTIGTMLSDTESITFAVHGDCIGSDCEFDYLCAIRSINIIAHPCDIEAKRAHCEELHAEYPYYFHARAPRPPLERNQTIVDEVDVLIVAPAGFEEEVRSGTWATVRRARRRGIPIFIVLPDGKMVPENV